MSWRPLNTPNSDMKFKEHHQSLQWESADPHISYFSNMFDQNTQGPVMALYMYFTYPFTMQLCKNVYCQAYIMAFGEFINKIRASQPSSKLNLTFCDICHIALTMYLQVIFVQWHWFESCIIITRRQFCFNVVNKRDRLKKLFLFVQYSTVHQ